MAAILDFFISGGYSARDCPTFSPHPLFSRAATRKYCFLPSWSEWSLLIVYLSWGEPAQFQTITADDVFVSWKDQTVTVSWASIWLLERWTTCCHFLPPYERTWNNRKPVLQPTTGGGDQGVLAVRLNRLLSTKVHFLSKSSSSDDYVYMHIGFRLRTIFCFRSFSEKGVTYSVCMLICVLV